MAKSKSVESALLATIAAGGPGIEERLRAALGEAGGPLIEAIADDPAHSVVTFGWIANASTNSVHLHSTLSTRRQPLDRLGESDAWAKSVLVGNGVRTGYQFFEDEPEIEIADVMGDPEKMAAYQAMQMEGLRADPFNPDAIPPQHMTASTPRDRFESVLTMAGARPQPWLKERPGVARGTTESLHFTSTSLGNERRVYVYTPPGFDRSGPALPLLLLLDGRAFRWIADTPTTMDNLISEGAVPPMVVAMMDNPTLTSRLSEYECNEPFANMIANELVPWLRERYFVATDPARTIIGGVSYGGLGSAFVALKHPEVFGNVLSMSGSYWWGPSALDAEWLTRQYAQAPATETKFYLDAGTLESLQDAPVAGATMIAVSRHLRDVLEAKGMAVTFDVFESGHEFVQWRASLADGLTWLTKGW